MRIAIIHYHLKRGGVTRVIESTLQGFNSLEDSPDCVILAGEVPDDFRYKGRARAIEGLHYSNAQAETPDSRELHERIREAAREALGGDPDIWHIHNHSLGKNSAMPGVVAWLAECGEFVLLHIHDFAEDGRPENYRLNRERVDYADDLYPNIGSVHYGVLNGRDYSIFKQAGFQAERLHLLANPVEASPAQVSEDSTNILKTLQAERLFLYPVRAVRRKNFGEMLLWAALANEGEVFATTLGPTNQNYVATYEQWQAFAKERKLPVRFGIGEACEWSFEAIMHSAHAVLSTSIAEGFGLAYLEPWLFGKTIVGRDLPDITADFKEHGIQLNELYESLPIPADWIDLTALKSAVETGLTQAYAAYERPLPADAVERALAAIRPSPAHIDFAGLNEALQMKVIRHVMEHPEAREQLPKLSVTPDPVNIPDNADLITNNYSLDEYARKLVQLYRRILASDNKPATQYHCPSKVLDGFLQPECFRLLRT